MKKGKILSLFLVVVMMISCCFLDNVQADAVDGEAIPSSSSQMLGNSLLDGISIAEAGAQLTGIEPRATTSFTASQIYYIAGYSRMFTGTDGTRRTGPHAYLPSVPSNPYPFNYRTVYEMGNADASFGIFVLELYTSSKAGLGMQGGYCVAWGVSFKDGAYLSRSYPNSAVNKANGDKLTDEQHRLLRYAAYYGYIHDFDSSLKSATGANITTYVDRYAATTAARAPISATQILLWLTSAGYLHDDVNRPIIEKYLLEEFDYPNKVGYIQKNGVDVMYRTMRDNIIKASKMPDYNGSPNFSSNKAKLTWNAVNNRYEVTLTDKNKVIEAGKLELLFTSVSGVNFSRSGNNLTIWTTDAIDGVKTVNIEKIVNGGNGDIWVGQQAATDQLILITVAGIFPHEYSNFQIETEALNDVYITKNISSTHNTQDERLVGAQFTAVSTDGKGLTYVSNVTGADGVAKFTGMILGSYRIYESTVPNTTLKCDDIYITIDRPRSAGVYNLSVTDEAKTIKIKLTKQFNTSVGKDSVLSDAIYGVYTDSACTNKIDEITTNAEGIGFSNELKTGTYYVKEIVPSIGCLLDQTVYTAEYNVNSQSVKTIEVNISSTEKAISNDIAIYKRLQETDCTPEQPLQGAQFTATLISNPSVVYTSTVTDENGYCVFKNVLYGRYTIEESVVPDTSLKMDNFIVNVLEDSSVASPYTYTKIDISKKMRITIDKRDVEVGKATQGDAKLDGAQYTFYRDAACTQAIETVTISNFTAESGRYLVGTYYVKETKAPEGYLIDETVYKIEQVPANQTIELTRHSITSNELVEKGNVYIVKYLEELNNNGTDSTTKNPATGAELTLYLDSNPTVNYTSVVNEIGYAEFIDIPYGWYTIKETKSIPGFDIIDPQELYISHDGIKLYYIMQDINRKREVEIVKKDAETGRVIPQAGAQFKIWDVKEGNYLTQTYYYPTPTTLDVFTTNAKGKLVLPENIIPGEYEIEEVAAPYGYILKSNRVKFTVEATTPENPQIVIRTSVDFSDYAQKARVTVIKTGEVFYGSKTTKKDGYNVTTPLYQVQGIQGVRYVVTAEEDITTPDGKVRMNKGQTISFVTGLDGIGKSSELYLGKYSIQEVTAASGYVLQGEKTYFELEYKGQDIQIYESNFSFANNRQKVSLSLDKEMQQSQFADILSNAYEDVKFGLYARNVIQNYVGKRIIPKNELIDIVTVDENGNATFNVDLPLGEYYIKEIETNPNYILDDTEYDFIFRPTDSTQAMTNVKVNNGEIIENKITDRLGSFTFRKISRANTEELDIIKSMLDGLFNLDDEALETMYLPGAVIKLYYDKNGVPEELFIDLDNDGIKEAAEFTTDINGEINVDGLPFGKYYYKEIRAPRGYEIDETMYSFELTLINADISKQIVLPNIYLNAPMIEKTDIFTGEKIPNCIFEIKDDEGNVIMYSRTNEDGTGMIPVTIFEDGKTYYYTEIDAPEIYNIDTTPHEFIAKFDIDGNWDVDKFAVSNIRKESDVLISKVDLMDSRPLPNCTFEIRSIETDFVLRGTTDDNGECYFEKIPYGEYYYQEIEAPDGYLIDTRPHYLKVDVEDIKIEVANEKSNPNTSDIQVVIISLIALISVLGLVLIYIKAKKSKDNK